MFSTIVVGTDGSAPAEAAVRVAGELALAAGVERVHVVSGHRPYSGAELNRMARDLPLEFHDTLRTDALAAESVDEAAMILRTMDLQPHEHVRPMNGTDAILGMLCLAVDDARQLLAQADMVAAMTVEGLMATDRPFADDLQALRPQPGQAVSARNLRTMLADSPIVASHATDDPRVQDAYSIRCTPSVHGAVRDTLDHCRAVAQNELASAIDNPMVFADGRVESCGNFHGAPLGFAADFLAIAVTEIGAISERRMDRMLDKTRSHGLPPFLAEEAGVDSGLMIGHYTAAAMASENKRLAAPASVDSLPTSGMQEDHVSMAWLAARKLRKVIDNVRRILAVEYVCAARAIDYRAPLEPSPATDALRRLLRTVVDGPGPDRHLSPELRETEQLLRSNAMVDAVQSVGITLA